MINFLNSNNFFIDFWDGFVTKLQSPFVWLAIVFAIVGITVAILAKRIARLIKKKNEIADNDGAFITFKIVALLFVIASVLIFIFA